MFLSVIGIAMVLLIVSTNRNNGFFSNVDIIKQSKESDILFSQIRTMIATLVTFANSKYSYASDPNLSNLTSFIVDQA